VLIEFKDQSDLERVLLGEPWSYDKYLIAFQRVGVGIAVEDLQFNRVDFWVQIQNLPILCMKKSVAETLGRSIGEVIRAQVHDEDSRSGRGMRVRVRVDITKPLNRGRRIGMSNGGEGWVSFQYERLPNFCYWCGIPTHGEKDCEVWLNTPEAEKDKEPEYGLWLRASQDRVLRLVHITVEGRSRRSSQPMGQNTEAAQPNQYPQGAAVVQPSPMEFDPTDMETAEYQGGINSVTDFTTQKSGTFEDQLREIDMALNFNSVTTENIETGGKAQTNGSEKGVGPNSPAILSKKVIGATNDIRSPLRDLTNTSAGLSQKPKVGTWKKLARAKRQGTNDTRRVTVAEKRACEDVIQVEEDEMRSMKSTRVLENDFISVAASVQPCRIQ
jgi:hypothetical protein